MKLMRYGDRYGSKIPCVLDADGVARDASSIVTDFNPQTLAAGALAKVSAVNPADLPVADIDGKRLAPPVAQPLNIWCVGLNYSDHAAEAGMEIPEEPILFNKASSTYCGANDNILYSPKMTKLDWEVELGIVIGKPALNIDKSDAMDHIAGFVLVNDISERAWSKARAFRTSAPPARFW